MLAVGVRESSMSEISVRTLSAGRTGMSPSVAESDGDGEPESFDGEAPCSEEVCTPVCDGEAFPGGESGAFGSTPSRAARL